MKNIYITSAKRTAVGSLGKSLKNIKKYIMNLKLNNKQLELIGVNSLKNGNIPSIRNLITGNKVSLEKITKYIKPKKTFRSV